MSQGTPGAELSGYKTSEETSVYGASCVEGLCCCAANLLAFCQDCSSGNFSFDQYCDFMLS